MFREENICQVFDGIVDRLGKVALRDDFCCVWMGTLAGRTVGIDVIKTSGREKCRTGAFFDDVRIGILFSIFSFFEDELLMFVFVRLMDSNVEHFDPSFFICTTGFGGCCVCFTSGFGSGIRLYLLGFDRGLIVSTVNAVILPRACRRGMDFGSSLIGTFTFGWIIRLFEVGTIGERAFSLFVVTIIFESDADSVDMEE